MEMQSIKISTKTKKKIEQTQAELLLHRSQKISQAEIIEKIIENATSDPEFIARLFPEESTMSGPNIKKQVMINIASRKKPKMRLFEDEWTD